MGLQVFFLRNCIFFVFFFVQSNFWGIYDENTKELSCINAITLDSPAICKAYFAHAPATKKRGGLSAWQMLYKSQSSALSIAYDTGQFFLGMHIYP